MLAKTSFVPASYNRIAPQSTNAQIAHKTKKYPADGTAEQEGRPDLIHLVQQKLPRKFEVKRLVGSIHQPGPDLIGTIEKHWHGNRVAYPDKANRQGQVNTEQDGKACSHDHLAGERNKCHKEAHGKGPGGRPAVETPQIGVVKHITENLERFLALDYVMAWQETSNYLSWHFYSFVIVATRL
ncbi:hypothetical protein BIT28_21945 [Photobacterium proteolyticum]|uniref:Uncharacterized protein n=1 Tax=Photobacterium proteolyticum TaxID=1903952 RepID=A0A1Q9GGC8_9GAMM|nr:hypothetical protein BIT28_21945 [Photobacterium proteolyticum]